MIRKLWNAYQKYNGWYWVSVIATLVMGGLTLASFLKTHENFYTAILVFYLYIIFLRTVNLLLSKRYQENPDGKCSYLNPLFTGVNLFLGSTILTMVLLVLINKKPLIVFPFASLIYGYAAYAFLKMGMAIKDLVAGLRQKNGISLSLSAVSFLSGMYTMLSLAVNLIGTYSDGDDKMKSMEIQMLAAIGTINLLFAIYLIIFGHQKRKEYKKSLR